MEFCHDCARTAVVSTRLGLPRTIYYCNCQPESGTGSQFPISNVSAMCFSHENILAPIDCPEGLLARTLASMKSRLTYEHQVRTLATLPPEDWTPAAFHFSTRGTRFSSSQLDRERKENTLHAVPAAELSSSQRRACSLEGRRSILSQHPR